jgi:hypothetical protein
VHLYVQNLYMETQLYARQPAQAFDSVILVMDTNDTKNFNVLRYIQKLTKTP